MVYIDMDGVIDNFGAWLRSVTSDLSHDGIDKAIADHWQECYKDPPVIAANLHLLTDFKDFRILSAVPSPHTLLKNLRPEDITEAMRVMKLNKLLYMERLGVPRHKVIITNGATEKSVYCVPGDILYDDYKANIRRWERAGGIGVHVKSDRED
ncbi:MAG: hypothetical protein SPL30_03840 [Succinivibrio sp.]|jgi:hypothetical protein|nr:hypothetical protein [Succinivibrio sp.]